jgi:hypothetical protein
MFRDGTAHTSEGFAAVDNITATNPSDDLADVLGRLRSISRDDVNTILGERIREATSN